MTPGTCETMFAGYCLGIPRTNALMATWLFGAAAVLFDRWWLEVRR